MKTVVGEAASVTITAAAPADLPLHIHHALPIGVQADSSSLQSLVSAGTIEKFVVMDGSVDLYAPRRAPGQVFSATYRVVPTFAGILHSGPSSIEAGGHVVQVPPALWKVSIAGARMRSAKLATAL
jgi:hypothetical protein